MRTSTLRTPHLVGWLAVAGLVGSAILGPGAGAAFANDLHQSPPISWDASGYDDSECANAELEPGQVLWHFVQTQVDESTSSGELTADFDVKGEVTVDSYKQSGGVLHWAIITGHDTLLDASSDVASDGELNLSHICVGPDETEQPSETPSEQPSETPSEQPSETPSEQPSETPSEQPSEQPSETPSEQPSETPSEQPSETPSEQPSETPSETATPTGSVEVATGTPRLTPPSTDTIASTTTSTAGDGLRLALLGLAALISAALVLTPGRKAARKAAKRD